VINLPTTDHHGVPLEFWRKKLANCLKISPFLSCLLLIIF